MKYLFPDLPEIVNLRGGPFDMWGGGAMVFFVIKLFFNSRLKRSIFFRPYQKQTIFFSAFEHKTIFSPVI